MLKSYGVVGWCGVGGPWDFSVSPSPFGLDFGTLDLGLTKIETQWWEALQED